MATPKPASTPKSAKPTPAADREYTVLARRYRPQQFADLVGQEHIARALTNALQTGRVAHAYLFTGNRGVGKTSAARILSKALNCLHGPTATPCDTCEICRSIAAGEDVDVLEIDGASNRGIDEVREIRQNVQYRPSRARYKIYIIDEVHMLTREAFNALLKTLEEPPPHVKFVFATTEVQKIPVTILSRCQRFDFAGISVAKITEQLERIALGEKMEVERDALELIARRAGGSMRDAESILDQLLAFSDKKVDSDTVHQLLGTAHDARIVDLARAILDEDPGKALTMLANAADEGLDLGELLDQLIEYWRDMMVVQCAGLEGQALSVGSAHRELLAQHARTLSLDSILAGLDILANARWRMDQRSQHARVIVETAIVRLGRLGQLLSLSQISQWLKKPQLVRSSATQPGAAPSAPRPAALPDTPVGAKKNMTASVENNAPVEVQSVTEATLPQLWEKLLSELPSRLAIGLRKEAQLAISGPNILVIQFSARYNSLRKECQDPERINQFEKLLQQITGRYWKVRIETTNDENGRLAAGDGVASSGTPRPRVAVLEHPLMKRAAEVLGAQLVRQEDGFGHGLSDSNIKSVDPESGE